MELIISLLTLSKRSLAVRSRIANGGTKPSRETAVEDLRYDVSRFIRDMENQMRKQMDSRDDALVASRVSMQSTLDEYLDRHIRETEIVARVINEAREVAQPGSTTLH